MADILRLPSQMDSPADKGWGRARSRLREPTHEEVQALKNRDVAYILDTVAWAGSPPVDDSSPESPVDYSTPDFRSRAGSYCIEDSVHTRQRRPKGNRSQTLKVGFVQAPPEIIGEGGNESKEPVMTVSRSRQRKPSISVGTQIDPQLRPQSHRIRTSPQSLTGRPLVPSPSALQLAFAHDISPTNTQGSHHTRTPSYQSFSSVHEEVQENHVYTPGTSNRMIIRGSPDSRRMLAEEGRRGMTNRKDSAVSSIDMDECASSDGSPNPRCPMPSPHMSRHNSFDSISSVEGCILGSSPRLGAPSVQQPARRRQLSNAPQMTVKSRASSTSNYDMTTSRHDAMKQPIVQSSPRIVCLMSSSQTPSPSFRQYSWEKATESPEQKGENEYQYVAPCDPSPDPDLQRELAAPVAIPERHPDRPFTLSPLRFERTVTSAELFQQKRPDQKHLLQPHFDRRDSAPDLNRGRVIAGLTSAPKFLRRPSAPFFSVNGGTISDLNHPAFRQSSMDDMPEIDERPTRAMPSDRRGSAVTRARAMSEAPYVDRNLERNMSNIPRMQQKMSCVPQMERKMSYIPEMERKHSYIPQPDRQQTQSQPQYHYQPTNHHNLQSQQLAEAMSTAFAMPTASVPSAERCTEAPLIRPEGRRSISYLDAKNAALSDFVERTSHMASIISLSAQTFPAAQITAAKWLQLATFWLLKGRAGLDIYLSSMYPDSADCENPSPTYSAAMLTQPHLNIYKAWWIISEILEVRLSETESPEFLNADERYRAAVFGLTDALVVAFKDLALRISEEGLLSGSLVLVPGLDSSLWMGEQSFPEDLRLLRRMLNPT